MARYALACILLLGVQPAAQHSFVVDRAGRPGTTHATIQAAIDVALPGDRILVRADGTTPYASFALAKGIDLRSDTGSVPVEASAIRGLPAFQWARVEGFDFDANPGGGSQARLELDACLGPILLRDVVGTGGAYSLLIRDCWSVLVEDSTARSALTGGVFVLRSLVHFEHCNISSTGLLGNPLGPAVGLRSEDATVFIHDSQVAGADGNDGVCSFFGSCIAPAGDGGIGIVSQGTSRVSVFGGSSVRGGVGGRPGWCQCPIGTPGAAIFGLALLDPTVVISGARGGSFIIPRQPSFVGLPPDLPRGSMSTVQVRTDANALVAVALDVWQGGGLFLGTELPWMLSPTADSVLAGAAGASGVASFTVGAPNDPSLIDILLPFQAGVLIGGSQLRLSNVSTTRIR
ncbi:MAG: hypothetical protein IPM29_31765 [Planctomycetes bacterium]|nr:hypothetical protein [Planctomycetota bacterium]